MAITLLVYLIGLLGLGYSLLKFYFLQVLTPFRNYGNLPEIRTNYNFRHASSRVVIEQAFGRLKGMWRRMKYLSSTNIEIAVRTIVASCVLHNYLLLQGDVDWVSSDSFVILFEQTFSRGQILSYLALPQFQQDYVEEPPQEQEVLDVDMGGGDDMEVDHPDVVIERDHPLLANAKLLGREKRLDLIERLPR